MSEGMPDAEMMAKWTAACTPSEAHEKLKPLVGTWEVTRRMWCGVPEGGTAPESKGRAEARMILSGRWLEERQTGEFMGQPYESICYTGYDNARKRYVGSYIDNMVTSLFTISGGMEDNVWTAFGTIDEPMTGEYGKLIRYVSRIIDNDHHTFDIFDASREKERRVQELIYRRIK